MSGTRISRRQLIRAAGLGSLAVAGTTLEGAFAPVAARGDDSPASFLATHFAERAKAALTGDTSYVDRNEDPTNATLGQFDRERAAYIAHGKLFTGRLLDHSSTISIVDLSVSGNTASARLRERFETAWVPPSATIRTAAGSRPAPRGPRGEMRSVAEIKHEVDLERSASGWRVTRDAHDEFDIYGRSPDLRPGSWAAEIFGVNRDTRTSSLPSVPVAVASTGSHGRGLASPLASGTYARLAAYDYAGQYAINPYPMYCNYDPCNGDCTNFMSQCLRQGGHPDWGTYPTSTAWATSYSGGACGTCPGVRATYAGTDTWANANWGPNFVLNSGRGRQVGTLQELLSADVINYDWVPTNGWYDHVTITRWWLGNGTPVICCHSPFRFDYQPWDMGQPSAGHRFININDTFP